MSAEEEVSAALSAFMRLLAANGIDMSEEQCRGALPEFMDMQKHIDRVRAIRPDDAEPSHTLVIPVREND